MPGFTTIAMACFALLYVPLFFLVLMSFNAGDTIAVWQGFSWKWYVAAWNNERLVDSVIRSVEIAVISASIATVVATMAAVATTRNRGFRGQTAIYAFINQPLMVPEIVTAIALLIFFAIIKLNTGYYGLGYLLAAHTAFCIPFAYLPIRARLEDMDLALERAAADLYATPWQTFRRVTLPLLWPGILAGLMLAFVISLDDVVITSLILSPGQETLPVYMMGQIRRVVSPELNAVSTVFLAISAVIVTVFFFLSRKRT